MTTLGGLLNRVGSALAQAGVPYVIGGSFALAALGHIRATTDLDIMVLTTDLDLIGRVLGPPAFRQINEVTFEDETTGLTLDVFAVRDDAQRAAFGRTLRANLHGAQDIRVLDANGLSLMLLREATSGTASKRHQRIADIITLAKNHELDWPWLQETAETNGFLDAMARVQRELATEAG